MTQQRTQKTKKMKKNETAPDDNFSNEKLQESNTPVNALLILDGWGINSERKGNATAIANTPFLDMLELRYPCAQLLCSGEAVGLPEGVMGNSEVGHMNIGAGRKVFQDLVRINKAINDGSFFKNKALITVMQRVKTEKKALHLIGLLSDGGVHSHIDHLFALIDMAAAMDIKEVFIHPILDGRDTSPTSGAAFLTKLENYITEKKTGRIATLCGRFYAMDRDTRWDRIETAYNLYTQGIGERKSNPVDAVKDSYEKGETDEFVKPIFFIEKTDKNNIRNSHKEKQKTPGIIRNGDGVIFFNFRADRAREITKAFTEDNFSGFDRKTHPCIPDFLCMTLYDESFPLSVIFEPQHLDNILGEIISRNNYRQLRIAETEKYAHVTYFFNGGDEKIFPLEERVLIPSPRDVSTYDEKPEMSAQKVADQACEKIKSGRFKLVVLNFANMDMVGHTGIIEAAVKACETVDSCAKQVVEQIWNTGGTAMVTADHGNAEEMIDANGLPHTSHTLNPVRFILAGEKYKNKKLKNGILGDIAPTILEVMDLKKPEEMTGNSLLL